MSGISDLDNLIHLLDDPDREAFEAVSGQIVKLGLPVIKPLENAWFSTGDALTRSRIEELVHQIQFENLLDEVKTWSGTAEQDLWQGFVLLTKVQFPNIEETQLLEKFNKLVRKVWVELNDDLTGLEKIKTLNHILFVLEDFKGEPSDNDASEHFFLNNLLQSKQGNSYSVGLLYVLMAQRLKLPVQGLHLPGNIIACYLQNGELLFNEGEWKQSVKFYINPLAKGSVFTHKEITLFCEQTGIKPEKKFFEPIDNLQLWLTVCRELAMVYQKEGNAEKAREINRVVEVAQKAAEL